MSFDIEDVFYTLNYCSGCDDQECGSCSNRLVDIVEEIQDVHDNVSDVNSNLCVIIEQNNRIIELLEKIAGK